jgi:putative ABC transport system permease protein
VVSPEFLDRNEIKPYQIKDREKFINERNDLYRQNINEDATDQYFHDFIKDNSNNVILNSSGMPFIVIGSGITADFTYPILDIEHSNPNPNNECIIFGNTHAYNRMFDAYRGNFSENYLVGTFKKGVDPKETLGDLNAFASESMS